MKKSNLIILDQSLVNKQGHHFELAHLLSLAAQNTGLGVKWLTHIDFSVDTVLSGVQVYPHLSATMYDQYKKGGSSEAPATLAEQIKSGLERCEATPDDYLLIHTGDGSMYRALDEILTKYDYRSLPQIHVCTPYDIKSMPGKTPKIPLQKTFAALRNHDALNRSLFFWAETAPLAQHMTDTMGIETLPLEIPPAEKYSNDMLPLNGPVTFVYMGAAREEKGFHLLPKLIKAVSERVEPGDVFFDIQASPQIIGYLPIIKTAIGQLEKFPETLVNLRRKNQTTEAYKKMLMECHGVLLMYDHEKYRIRGSGIAVEAVSYGKILVATRDTFPASLISHKGGVIGDSIDEFADGIVDVVKNKQKYMRRGALQLLELNSRSSSDGYMDRILNRKQYASHLVSSPFCIMGTEFPLMVSHR